MSLRQKLREILPDILPDSPGRAIKGTELIRRVRSILGGDYSDRSYRSQFSLMMLDPESCLARVENGQGYYLRSPNEAGKRRTRSLHDLFVREKGEDEGNSFFRQLLALGARFQGACGKGVFVFPDEEEEAWNHPDLVSVTWPSGYWDSGAYCFLPSKGQESAPFYRSVCLASISGFVGAKRALFRALATSLWADEAELMLFGNELLPGDEGELVQLGAMYGVGILLIPLTNKQFDQLPGAGALFRADDEEWREMSRNIPCRVLFPPRFRRSRLPVVEGDEIAVVRSWVEGCLARRRVEACELRVSIS